MNEQTSADETTSEWDLDSLAQQLDRVPRGVVSVAARCRCGKPTVVETAPRLPDGSPFPTLYYLTHPQAVLEISRLEANQVMEEMNARLAGDDALVSRYLAADDDYIARRRRLGDVEEIAGVSAGGMPTRVKCLHALLGHSLAVGPGINPFGDEALERIDWKPETCTCTLPMNYEIGVGDVAEAEAISAYYVDQWHRTYQGSIPDRVLERITLGSMTPHWIEVFATQDETGWSEPFTARYLVARHRGGDGSVAPVGTIAVGPPRESEPVTDLELRSLYVHRDHMGTGIARALVDRGLGTRPASLWVFEGNARAIAFYRKLGFEPDGVTKFDDSLSITELRMVRR